MIFSNETISGVQKIQIFFQGSVLVRFFTKFTKDIFASLVSLLFIFSALKKLNKVRRIEHLTFHYNPSLYFASDIIRKSPGNCIAF